jgi:DNA-binding LytR/AlgR family response regulator
MRIAICDDEKVFRDDLKQAIYTYSNVHRLELVVDEYLCGENLLDSKQEYEIIFLDFKMGGINGLETARILRKRNINCTIIFLTSYSYFIYESFEVSTFRFFKKPLDSEKLFKALDKYFESFGNDYPLLIKVGHDTILIKTNSILFLEADNKKCYINLAGEKLHCAKTMGSVANLIPKSIFCKVHKAFIVNFNYISNYDKEYIHIMNGERVPVSRKYISSFKEAYRIYAKGRSL